VNGSSPEPDFDLEAMGGRVAYRVGNALTTIWLVVFVFCSTSCSSFRNDSSSSFQASAGLHAKKSACIKLAPFNFDCRLDSILGRDSADPARAKFGSRFTTSVQKRWQYTAKNFKENPWQYLSIPFVAAFVGYITNYLGVNMLFYPIEWTGIPIKVWEGQPWGLFGWRGVVPARRHKMASTMVDVTISRLLSITEVFAQLEPGAMAAILCTVVQDVVLGGWVPWPVLNFFLHRVSADMIKNIEGIINIKDLVVRGLTTDPRVLGDFFQRVGSKELSFLVSSGTYFGFLLGLAQMVQWMIYPKNWTLPVGGAVVGYVTNWIALKWIFEPLYPTKVGPFVLQGLFLRRQKEVSLEFSTYISEKVLNSQEVWKAVMTEPSQQKFGQIISRNVPFMSGARLGAVMSRLKGTLVTGGGVVTSAAAASGQLLHKYTDAKLGLKELLVERMNKLSPAEFEQVLHPIFQADEMILIVAGGVLGFMAGGLQWWINVEIEKRRLRKLAAAPELAGVLPMPIVTAGSMPMPTAALEKEPTADITGDSDSADDATTDTDSTDVDDSPSVEAS
jgi:uncharacterized membrane protein YheB (UPF0754 family)